MGHKVNPIGIRLKTYKNWNNIWYAPTKKDFAVLLNEDLEIEKLILSKISKMAKVNVGSINIERSGEVVKINIHTSKPGLIIGRTGDEVDKIKSILTNKFGRKFSISVVEIRKPDLVANIVASQVSQQLEKRVLFRKAMKRAISNSMRSGAKGIKIAVSGRLNGAEIARTEYYKEGRVPLHTFRADIDYATSTALTTYGIIGVKVWIFKGEILDR